MEAVSPEGRCDGTVKLTKMRGSEYRRKQPFVCLFLCLPHFLLVFRSASSLQDFRTGILEGKSRDGSE